MADERYRLKVDGQMVRWTDDRQTPSPARRQGCWPVPQGQRTPSYGTAQSTLGDVRTVLPARGIQCNRKKAPVLSHLRRTHTPHTGRRCPGALAWAAMPGTGAAHQQDSPGGVQAIAVSHQSPGSRRAEALPMFYTQFQPYNEQVNLFQTKCDIKLRRSIHTS